MAKTDAAVKRLDDAVASLRPEVESSVERAGETAAAATKLIDQAAVILSTVSDHREDIVSALASVKAITTDSAAVIAKARGAVDSLGDRVDTAREKLREAGAPVDGPATGLLWWAVKNPVEAWALAGSMVTALVGSIVGWRSKSKLAKEKASEAEKTQEALAGVTHVIEDQIPPAAREAVKDGMVRTYGGSPIVSVEVRKAKRRGAPPHVPGAPRAVP